MLLPVITYWDTETHMFVNQTLMQTDGIPIVSVEYSISLEGNARYDRLAEAPSLNVKLLNENAKLPTRGKPDDAGLDIYATESVILKSRFSGSSSILGRLWRWITLKDLKDPSRTTISTGLAFEVPQGLGLFIWDRSGLAHKSGLHRLAGVLDSSYRDELKIVLINLSNKNYEIKVGDRIAQGILAPIILSKPKQVDELSTTSRGKGFGSSGR